MKEILKVIKLYLNYISYNVNLLRNILKDSLNISDNSFYS